MDDAKLAKLALTNPEMFELYNIAIESMEVRKERIQELEKMHRANIIDGEDENYYDMLEKDYLYEEYLASDVHTVMSFDEFLEIRNEK